MECIYTIGTCSHGDSRFVHFFDQPTYEMVRNSLRHLNTGRFMVVVDIELPLSADNVRQQEGGVNGKLVLTIV